MCVHPHACYDNSKTNNRMKPNVILYFSVYGKATRNFCDEKPVDKDTQNNSNALQSMEKFLVTTI